ncbi:hypothetical protein LSCM4_06321 [Leishmania orientalis]|uniref:Uncharacterized protein n=1 Tax=Leishmania orientalis TaxID=2249476 RepID=A0A836HMJ2_9TRYP|nr:hypothetical protein LSCM4_06321 [Leishmania orientalis]
MSSPRTHVVDLSGMPREELIEIAKKQSRQIREKNTRISAMEAFIESVTGASAEVSLSHSPHTVSNTTPPSSSTEAVAFCSAASDSATAASASASELLQLQRTLEEERSQHTSRVSQLEEQLRQWQLDYDQLQAKVEGWKKKVMSAMTADQERIRGLEAQLAAAAAAAASQESLLAHAPSGVPFALPTALSPGVDETYASTQRQQLEAQVCSLEQELYKVKEQLHQAQSQLHELRCSPQQPQLPSAAAASTTENSLIEVPSTALDSPPSFLSPALSDNTPSPPEAAKSAADIPPEVLRDAVHTKLASWKERVKVAMLADKTRIEELEVQLAAMRAATNAGHASEADDAAKAEALRAEVSRLQGALQTSEQEREALVESAGSELEICRSAFQQQISELKSDIDGLRAAAAVVQEDRDAALRASASEHAAVEVLRAEVSRLQGALQTTECERDNATVSMKAFRERMEEWKVKMRSALEEGESQRHALEAEVQRLKEQQHRAAAAATAQLEVESPQADVMVGAEEANAMMSYVAATEEDLAVRAFSGAEAPVQVSTDVPSVPSSLVLPELHLSSMQTLLMEVDRVAAENKRLRRVVAMLTRFRAEVMREVRAVAVPFSATVS